MASLLVVIAVVFAYQAIVLTPTTAGTVDRDVKSQVGTRAGDVLTAANDQGALSGILRHWTVSGNNNTGAFVGTPVNAPNELGYHSTTPPGRFGELLTELTDDGYVINVYLESRDPENPSQTNRYVLLKRGEPTGNAATASRTVTLYDHQHQTRQQGDSLVADEGTQRLGELGGDDYFTGNLDGPVYNTVTVRVVVW
jgi:hypothetical protein